MVDVFKSEITEMQETELRIALRLTAKNELSCDIIAVEECKHSHKCPAASLEPVDRTIEQLFWLQPRTSSPGCLHATCQVRHVKFLIGFNGFLNCTSLPDGDCCNSYYQKWNTLESGK